MPIASVEGKRAWLRCFPETDYQRGSDARTLRGVSAKRFRVDRLSPHEPKIVRAIEPRATGRLGHVAARLLQGFMHVRLLECVSSGDEIPLQQRIGAADRS